MAAKAPIDLNAASEGFPSPNNAPGAAENVERIREILFGSQIREYAQRFQQMEERFAHEIGALKTEARRHMETVEAHARQEWEALAARLTTERTERSQSAERISRELMESVNTLDRRLRESEEQISKELREFRQAELDSRTTLSDELTQSLASAGTLQGKRLEELRAGSVDRAALANLLLELSRQIRGDQTATPTPPATGAKE